MTLQEVNLMMSEMASRTEVNGCVYHHYDEGSAPELPYLIFYYPSSDNESADNVVWSNINRLNIELYTDNKEFSIENEIEAVLSEHGFFYEKSEQYIKDEKMYEVLYEMEVFING